jgi:hypothetical protein
MIVSTQWPVSSAAASPVAALGVPSTADEASMISRAVVEKEVADATTVKKVADDAVVDERAAADKKSTDVAVEKKAADDAAAAERATAETASWGVVQSSHAPTVGAKRTAVYGGSTPAAKWRFCGSWRP